MESDKREWSISTIKYQNYFGHASSSGEKHEYFYSNTYEIKESNLFIYMLNLELNFIKLYRSVYSQHKKKLYSKE